jgi:hypothetical protein
MVGGGVCYHWILVMDLRLGVDVGIASSVASSGLLSNHLSYVICAFTYRMVESDIVLLYIRSHVCGVIYAVGPGVLTV